jgi:hypothetical protein
LRSINSIKAIMAKEIAMYANDFADSDNWSRLLADLLIALAKRLIRRKGAINRPLPRFQDELQESQKCIPQGFQNWNAENMERGVVHVVVLCRRRRRRNSVPRVDLRLRAIGKTQE